MTDHLGSYHLTISKATIESENSDRLDPASLILQKSAANHYDEIVLLEPTEERVQSAASPNNKIGFYEPNEEKTSSSTDPSEWHGFAWLGKRRRSEGAPDGIPNKSSDKTILRETRWP